jgi:hypothetical protein
MSLKDKYHIDNSVWIDMIRNGVISCSISKQEDILACLKKHKETGIEHCEAVKRTSEDMRVSVQWVYEVIKRWGQ